MEVGHSLDRCLRRISTLLPKRDWSFPPIPTDGAEDEYRKAISQRLTELRFEQPDHSGVVLMTHSRRSTNTAILIQMIVNYLVQTHDAVAIVTANSRDFGIPGKLSDDFQADLQQQGIQSDRVQIYKTIFDFVKDHVKPRMKKRDELIDAMNNETHPFDSNRLFADRHDEILKHQRLHRAVGRVSQPLQHSRIRFSPACRAIHCA